MGEDFSRAWTPQELRKKGWVPEDEACDLLGLPKGEMISWDFIESEQWGADGLNWVKPKKGVQAFGRSGVRERRMTNGQCLMSKAVDSDSPSTSTRTRARTRRKEEWVTASEAAAMRGVCRKTVYKHLQYGRFQGFKLGREWRIPLSDVEKRAEEDWYEELEAYRARIRRPRLRPYRRDGVPLVSDEAVQLCMPYYGYAAIWEENEKVAAWEERFRRDRHDYATEADWVNDLLDEKCAITTEHVMEMLGITQGAVFALVRRGSLSRILVGKRPAQHALFSREQVEQLAAERSRRKWRRYKTPGEWAHDLMHPYVRTKIEAPPGDRLITTVEAAGILKVNRRRVSELVRAGRLFGYQEKPGRQGSRLWLSYNQLARYASRWDRVRRRAWRDGTAVPGEHVQARIPGIMTSSEDFKDEHGLSEYGTKNLNLNHGEFFSTRQAASELGISSSAVTNMRKRGDLLGFRKRRTGKSHGSRSWWFYRKEDVWALRSDAPYAERSSRSKAAYAQFQKSSRPLD